MVQQIPIVLDACCGPRMFWFDKNDRRALFVDRRSERHEIDVGTPNTRGRKPIIVDPDIVASFDALPFGDDRFSVVVFDPPHLERVGGNSHLAKKYGRLTGDWRSMLRHGFAECFRVLRTDGVLVFKWNARDVAVSEILKLTPHKPLIGQRISTATHWVVFVK